MLRDKLAELRETWKDEEVQSISRRYFISNGFDGTLSSIGITVGSYLSGVSTGLTVFKVGVGAAVGLATSGIWSVWEIEKYEKRAELEEKERAMLTNLEGTQLHKDMDRARVVNSAMSGLGPIIGIMSPVLPFLLEGLFYDMFLATVISVLVGVSVLFAFGSYMSKMVDVKWYTAGFRMGLAGLVVAAINILLPG